MGVKSADGGKGEDKTLKKDKILMDFELSSLTRHFFSKIRGGRSWPLRGNLVKKATNFH